MSTTPRTVHAEHLTPEVFAELGGSAGIARDLRDGSLVIVPRGQTPATEPPPAT